jgi:hypothetical protein
MQFRKLRAGAIAAMAAFGFVGSALANGRFPRAQRVLEMPGHPERLVIQATYGLLLTEDRGKHWAYVCDAAFSFQNPFASDAVVGLAQDGSILVGVQKSVTRSSDWGCDYQQVLVPTGTSSVDDFAATAAKPNELLALVTTFDVGSFSIHLQESLDGGLTWKEIGAKVPASLVYTIDIDPQNSNHLYVTGSSLSSDHDAPALFLTSNDRGANWEIGTIPGTNLDSSPWIAAVHPSDGNKIFVRTDSWKKNAGNQEVAGDALLYSDNGGKTWTELLRLGGSDPEVPGAKMLGFALSPDGATALVGYGDINDAVRVVDPDRKYLGIYKSSSDGRYSFGAGAPSSATPLLSVPTTCLGWTRDGAYGCFSPEGQSQYVAFSADATFASGSTETLMRASEVEGQNCACNGRAVKECRWSMDCAILGACDAGASGGACDGGGSGGGGGGVGGAGGAGPNMDASIDPTRDASAGASGSGGVGGAAGHGTGGDAGTINADAGPPPSERTDDCACRVPGSKRTSNPGPFAGLFFLSALFAARRLRSRRAQRRC